MIVDTPGIDDVGALGEARVRRTKRVLNKIDAAILVVDATDGKKEADVELIELFKAKNVSYIVALSKCDLLKTDTAATAAAAAAGGGSGKEIYVSAERGININFLKEEIGRMAKTDDPKLRIVGDIVQPNDFVILVTPIDSAAPKGRLILPQQQTVRDILEAGAISIVIRESELLHTLENIGKKPALVITDSQAFEKVNAEVPLDIPLTSFSILFARYKGALEQAVRGVHALDSIKDGSRILVCEGCTHHRQCDDIGTFKIPRWVKAYTGKNIEFEFRSGGDFPEDVSEYALVIHCGACMLNEREMRYRQSCAADQGIPFTNYGILIAHIQGILRRSVAIFPQIKLE
jgi:[FeFe] hydrogenase H-cluster maturation GTPase HydF